MRDVRPVFRSIEQIEARIAEKLTVENLARGVHFSRYYYQRMFRDAVGESVMEYVTKRRLTLAGRALLETGATILGVALRFGYDSHEGFTRSFKAYMGVTPSEYRKYGLAAISQKTVRERTNMTYSKTTDEIIRELNAFIAKAKETAEAARKCAVGAYPPFWALIADKTDALAGSLKDGLGRITAIAEQPDLITTMFDIIQMIDDVAYQTNLIAFNAKLMTERARPEHVKLMDPLCHLYRDLATMAVMKARKVMEFLNELSAMIVTDMKKTAAGKLQAAARAGKEAAARITGYNYIRLELENIAEELSSAPVGEITAGQIDDMRFRLRIIAFSAETDVFRAPADKGLFEGIDTFKSALNEAYEFFQTLIRPENTPKAEATTGKFLSDVAFQANMYLFYIRGEVEKLDKLPDKGQKAEFEEIYGRMARFIRAANGANEETDCKTLADMLRGVCSGLTALADTLGAYGGAIRLIAVELNGLCDAVARRA